MVTPTWTTGLQIYICTPLYTVLDFVSWCRPLSLRRGGDSIKPEPLKDTKINTLCYTLRGIRGVHSWGWKYLRAWFVILCTIHCSPVCLVLFTCYTCCMSGAWCCRILRRFVPVSIVSWSEVSSPNRSHEHPPTYYCKPNNFYCVLTPREAPGVCRIIFASAACN